ncbi:hypothetical protein B7R21_11245 [Subtercola boreus]|uniref:SHOCT domain-containing protein n=1 Tax=Subtercola boreus TaxID=120213 RepID=A0A3E0VQZ2_9MICO|nr:hypothetical protein B7R21_11245 [Subtercola boreus]
MVSAALTGPAGTPLTHWGPWGGPGPGGAFGWLFLLIPMLWIGLFALIFALAARRRRRFWAANGGAPGWGGAGGAGWGGHAWGPGWAGAAGAGTTSDAEKTLAERFARGDIDEVEYRARLEVLQSGRPAGPVPPTKA